MSVLIPKLSAKEYDGISNDLEMDLIDLFKVMEQDIIELFEDGMSLNDLRNEINKRFL